VISGVPPHQGEHLVDVLRAAFVSEPVIFADDTPKSLVAIVHRAMARDKDDRFASVDEFAAAIEGYLEHRGSLELADASVLVLDKLEAGLSGGGTSVADMTDLFAECRFGFRQALKQWPDNDVAQNGVKRTAIALILYYLAQGSVQGARATLDAMEAPDPGLQAKVKEAEINRAEEAEHLALLSRIAERFDPRVAQGLRSFLMILAGLLWGGSSLWNWVHTDLANTDEARMAHLWAVSRPVLIAFLLLLLFRRSLLANEINRRFGMLIAGTMTAMVLFRVGVVVAKMPMTSAIWAEFPLYAMAIGCVGLLYRKRLILLGAPFLITTILGARDPGNAALYLAICHVGVCTFVAWGWRPGARRNVLKVS